MGQVELVAIIASCAAHQTSPLPPSSLSPKLARRISITQNKKTSRGRERESGSVQSRPAFIRQHLRLLYRLFASVFGLNRWKLTENYETPFCLYTFPAGTIGTWKTESKNFIVVVCVINASRRRPPYGSQSESQKFSLWDSIPLFFPPFLYNCWYRQTPDRVSMWMVDEFFHCPLPPPPSPPVFYLFAGGICCWIARPRMLDVGSSSVSVFGVYIFFVVCVMISILYAISTRPLPSLTSDARQISFKCSNNLSFSLSHLLLNPTFENIRFALYSRARLTDVFDSSRLLLEDGRRCGRRRFRSPLGSALTDFCPPTWVFPARFERDLYIFCVWLH